MYPLVFDWIVNLSSIIQNVRKGWRVRIVEGWRAKERGKVWRVAKGGPSVSKGFRVFRITSCSAPELVCRDPTSNSFILTYRGTWSKYMRHYTELRTKLAAAAAASSNCPWIENKSSIRRIRVPEQPCRTYEFVTNARLRRSRVQCVSMVFNRVQVRIGILAVYAK